jgi:biotin-dependent carboxylase-like uncharacterized protein
MIEILTTAPLNSIQDLGRRGLLNAGVSRSGAMDRQALETGNALLGNDREDAGIEMVLFPFRLRFHTDTAFAITGADARAAIDGEPIPPNWARAATAGQELVIGSPTRGARAYLSFLGGIDTPPVLGSRSTDQKSGFGGLDGRGLMRGDRLSLRESLFPAKMFEPGFGAAAAEIATLAAGDVPTIDLRMLPAAEFDDFTDEARQIFTSTDWLVTNDSNRMGYRLAGAPLRLKQQLELFSHGLVPGTVQVPPAGQPMIQLSDANTCGGYPKIATVIEADLWRLAQAPVGSHLRFVETNRSAAVEALRQQADALAELRAVSALLRKRN